MIEPTHIRPPTGDERLDAVDYALRITGILREAAGVDQVVAVEVAVIAMALYLMKLAHEGYCHDCLRAVPAEIGRRLDAALAAGDEPDAAVEPDAPAPPRLH